MSAPRSIARLDVSGQSGLDWWEGWKDPLPWACLGLRESLDGTVTVVCQESFELASAKSQEPTDMI